MYELAKEAHEGYNGSPSFAYTLDAGDGYAAFSLGLATAAKTFEGQYAPVIITPGHIHVMDYSYPQLFVTTMEEADKFFAAYAKTVEAAHKVYLEENAWEAQLERSINNDVQGY